MRFIIGAFTQIGLWFIFNAAFDIEFMGDRYIMALLDCMLIGVTVGLIFGAWQDARKEDKNANAKEDADESSTGARGTNS